MLDVITGTGSRRMPYFVHVKGEPCTDRADDDLRRRSATRKEVKKAPARKVSRSSACSSLGYIELPVFPAAFIVPVEFM
jgi:hypothetical protein